MGNVEIADERGGDCSCTVITCAPNTAMGELHDRMPVILDEADWPKWLGEEPATPDKLYAFAETLPG